MINYLDEAKRNALYSENQQNPAFAANFAQIGALYAAIAQAEATEKIAALLDSVIEQVGSAKAINVYETYAAWKDTTG